jgi:two-component system, sensor histidine kinase YesM
LCHFNKVEIKRISSYQIEAYKQTGFLIVVNSQRFTIMTLFHKASRFFSNRSLKIKLLYFFLPLIFCSVLLTGVFSYLLNEKQLRDNADYLLKDTTYQTNLLLNDRFSTMFEQLYNIENYSVVQNMVLDQYASEPEQNIDLIHLNDRLNEIYRSYPKMIDSIYIHLNNGHQFQLLNDAIPIRVGIGLDDWLRRYQGSNKGYYWINDHRDPIFITFETRRVISCLKVIGTPVSKVKGLIVLNLKSEHFLEVMRNVRGSAHGYLALVSPDGILVSKQPTARYQLNDADLFRLRKSSATSGSYDWKNAQGEKLFIVYNTLQINQWRLVAVVPERDLLAEAGRIKTISLGIIIILSIISITLATIFAGNIATSVRYLSEQVKRVESGDFDTQFVIAEQNEIGVLAKGLTSLVTTVKQLLQKIREEQEKKRQIELLALQAQINPHFLYNTLGSIRHLIEMNENSRAIKMVGALTKFFMIGISRGKEIITVAEEIEHIRNYLLILQMRYSQDFDFEFAVNEEILNCKIIKLTLQPLVENSIYHGIKNKPNKGLFRISGYRAGHEAIIEVYDDGAGIDKARLEELRQSLDAPDVAEYPMTFGLRNVNERLRLYFGPEYGLTIYSELDHYTRIIVRLPFHEASSAGGEGNESNRDFIDRG